VYDVQAHVEWSLVGGVKEQLDAFTRGFLLLCDGPALSFLSPPELEVRFTPWTHTCFHTYNHT
jgi:hypothetical protein